MRRRVLVGAVVAVLVAVLGLWALGWRQVLAPVAPPAPSAFDAKQVERGRWLAALGSCGACHTASGGVPYAGGTAVQTRFGTVYGTNITPDPDHGIGRWSLEAFTRAMREGVSRDGRHLYPVFPYQHFTKLADDDIAALFAFLMTRDAIPADVPANRLAFPFEFRPLLAGWKLLFVRRDRATADTARDAMGSGGAYWIDATSPRLRSSPAHRSWARARRARAGRRGHRQCGGRCHRPEDTGQPQSSMRARGVAHHGR